MDISPQTLDFKGAISQIFIIMKKKTMILRFGRTLKNQKRSQKVVRVVLCTSFLLPLGRKPFCMLNTIKLIISDAIVEFK